MPSDPYIQDEGAKPLRQGGCVGRTASVGSGGTDFTGVGRAVRTGNSVGVSRPTQLLLKPRTNRQIGLGDEPIAA